MSCCGSQVQKTCLGILMEVAFMSHWSEPEGLRPVTRSMLSHSPHRKQQRLVISLAFRQSTTNSVYELDASLL